jgi:hypothetical protein
MILAWCFSSNEGRHFLYSGLVHMGFAAANLSNIFKNWYSAEAPKLNKIFKHVYTVPAAVLVPTNKIKCTR